MKTPPSVFRSTSIAVGLSLLLGSATALRAGLQVPYTANASTLHLWHLDDPNGLQATDTVTTASITLTNLGMPNPGTGPYTNASLGAPAFIGLGTCLSGTTRQHLLYGGAFTDVSQFCNPVSGAFTFEALARFDTPSFNPIDAEIVSGDNGLGLANRGWQWRLFNGVMEWNLLAGNSGDNDFKSPLPATGIDAAIPGAWYHLAVTYTGDNPTNSDPANVLTFYWTLLDANRTYASKLGQFTATRPLNGSPLGSSTPSLGVGGSARNITSNPGNNEGLIGSIDEVRISNVALRSNEMAFVAGGTINPPSFTRQPPEQVLVGYGRTLTIAALASGTPPLQYQWQHAGTNVAGQTETTLVISHPTFANDGDYQLVVTNNYGTITSTVARVVIGAAPTGLFNTGLDTNGAVSAGDIPDPHWTLLRSADPAFLGPNTLVFEYAYPIQFADPNGAFSPTNGISMWMGAGGNLGGVTFNSPAGQYIYRTTFVLDTADPATVTVGGNLWVNGSISDILLNGRSTGIALAPGGTLYITSFSITNGFVAGLNTLDFVETLTGNAISGLRVEISGVGLALPPGPPVISVQPNNQTVRDGNAPPNTSLAEFSVVALGRPPLSYQWSADGAPLNGATQRTLTFVNPISGGQGRNFSVVVSNDSGSVTSQVAVLTSSPLISLPCRLRLVSSLFRVKPSHFRFRTWSSRRWTRTRYVGFVAADPWSTNGATTGLANVLQTGATLVYTPAEGYLGLDQFGYTLSDQLDTVAGSVNILVVGSPQPVSTVVAPGGLATFSVGMSSAPPGYSFQWQLNGTNISGATVGQVQIANAQVADAGSYTLVVTDPLGQLWRSPVGGLTVGTPGNGTGLSGDYFAYGNGSTNFTGLPALTRVDPTVDFNWETAAPDPSLPADYFLVRWHGLVQPIYSDLYTFSTRTDDGARLWVNGQLLVNRWQNQGATTVSGNIALQAGRRYELVMEYYENTSAASAQLSWSSLHQPPQVIPLTQLYPDTGLLTPAVAASLSNQTNLVINWAGTFTLQSASEATGPWSTVANAVIGPYTLPVAAAPRQFYRLVEPIGP